MPILNVLKILELAASFLWMFILLYDFVKNKNINMQLLKYGIIALISLFVATAYFSTSIQFEVWKNDPRSQYLLPPFQPIDYFNNYSIYRFWLPYALDIAISIAWAFYLALLSKYSNKRFLDEKEIYLGFFTSLLVGWPNFIIYIFIVFCLVVAKQLFNYYIMHRKTLISIAPYMIVASILVLSLSLYYNDRLGLDKLKLVA